LTCLTNACLRLDGPGRRGSGGARSRGQVARLRLQPLAYVPSAPLPIGGLFLREAVVRDIVGFDAERSTTASGSRRGRTRRFHLVGYRARQPHERMAGLGPAKGDDRASALPAAVHGWGRPWAPAWLCCRERRRQRRNCGRDLRQGQRNCLREPLHHAHCVVSTPKYEMAPNFCEVILPICLSDTKTLGP
jgi:hypothetical protein